MNRSYLAVLFILCIAMPSWAQVGLTWGLLLLALGYGGQKYDFVYFAF